VRNRFYRRRWDETRGDQFDSWGCSTWYFEVGDDGWPVRQVEAYDAGPVLRYGTGYDEDGYGALVMQASTTRTTTGTSSKSRVPSSSGSGIRAAGDAMSLAGRANGDMRGLAAEIAAFLT
jgi:hypothetical protein